MSRMTSNYELGRRHESCAHTGETLAPGDRFVAVLVEHPESDELERMDYAEHAWDGGARPEKPRRVFAAWHATVPERDAKPGIVFDAGSVMSLFEQLDEPDDPKRLALRYVLALMLMGKKKLILKGHIEREDGTTVTLVTERGAGEDPPIIEVIDPSLDEATLASVAEQLDRVLGIADA